MILGEISGAELESYEAAEKAAKEEGRYFETFGLKDYTADCVWLEPLLDTDYRQHRSGGHQINGNQTSQACVVFHARFSVSKKSFLPAEQVFRTL